jgi:DNA-binding MarR family transcriptional regulator
MALRTSRNRRLAVADAVHSAAIHLLRGVRKEDERTGVGPARLSALSVLVFGGPMRLTELARIEQVKPPTMTKVIAGLEAGGLVRRRPDPGDARAVRLEATARGRNLLQAGRRRRVARLGKVLQTLGPEELDVLRRAAVIIERVSPML